MKRTLLVIALIGIQVLVSTNISFAECTQERYKEPIFNSISIDYDVKYGENINNKNEMQDLKMDVFRPSDHLDENRERPIVILLHGGAYVGGSKSSSTIQFISQKLAERGYVAIALQYRLELGKDEVEAILRFANKINWYKAIIRSVQDVRGAIRYLKHTYADEGNPYGIDTNNVTLYGSSAGAIGILHATYMDDDDNYNLAWQQAIKVLGGLEGTSSPYLEFGSVNSIRNLIVDSGALGEIDWIGDKNDVDVLSLHNINDPTVPYRHGCFYTAACHLGRFYGAHNYIPVMRANGTLVTAIAIDKVEHPVDDHNPQFALEQTVNFLYDAQCRYEPVVVPTGIFAQNQQQLNLYPNPSKGNFTVQTEGVLKVGILQIFSLSGQQVFERTIRQSQEQFNINLPSGIYLVTLQNEKGQRSATKLVLE